MTPLNEARSAILRARGALLRDAQERGRGDIKFLRLLSDYGDAIRTYEKLRTLDAIEKLR